MALFNKSNKIELRNSIIWTKNGMFLYKKSKKIEKFKMGNFKKISANYKVPKKCFYFSSKIKKWEWIDSPTLKYRFRRENISDLEFLKINYPEHKNLDKINNTIFLTMRFKNIDNWYGGKVNIFLKNIIQEMQHNKTLFEFSWLSNGDFHLGNFLDDKTLIDFDMLGNNSIMVDLVTFLAYELLEWLFGESKSMRLVENLKSVHFDNLYSYSWIHNINCFIEMQKDIIEFFGINLIKKIIILRVFLLKRVENNNICNEIISSILNSNDFDFYREFYEKNYRICRK